MSYRRTITAKLYQTDSTTEVTSALANAFGAVFMKELNGFGTGSINLPFGDAHALDLQRGRYVAIFVEGVRKFTFLIEGSPKYQQIDEGEDSAQFWTVSGRGWGCVWEQFQIYPDGGLAVAGVLDYSYRLFSFASIDFPNSGAWNPAQELYEYLDGVSYGVRVASVVDPGPDPDTDTDDVLKLYPAPIGFPWPNAPKNGNGFAPTAVYDPTYWVIADGTVETDIGYHFFRGEFGLGGLQDVSIFVTADNFFTLYLNGVPILGEMNDSLVWQGWKEITLTLPAGVYTVAAVCQNIDADVTYNPAGLIMNIIAISVYPGDVETTLTLSVFDSSAAEFTESYFAATDWPGWSPAQILDAVASEAQARGCIPYYVGGTYTDFADSNSNAFNSADPDTSLAYVPAIGFKLSDSGADVLTQLHDEGWFDWEFSGDVLELNIYTPFTLGGAAVAAYTQGTNIVGLERGETRPYQNALLVQYDGGFTEVTDAVEIAAFGARVEGQYSTDAPTVADAQRLGRVELERRKVSANSAILISVEPVSTTDCPTEGVNLGDYVTIPTAAGGTEDVQVLAITCEQDDEGFASWRLELNERWRTPPDEEASLLRQIGGKTLGSAPGGVSKD